MAYWLIELEGTKKALKFLRKFLHSSELSVVDDHPTTYLKTLHLGNENDTVALLHSTDRLIEVLNGAAALLWPHFENVSSHNIYRVSDDGTRSLFSFLTTSAHDYRLYTFQPNDPSLIDWISLSNEDFFVERVLTLYRVLEHDWRGLYMFIEVVSDDLGNWDKLVHKGWISKNQLRVFKHTANSYSAVGRSGRHSMTSLKPPSKPMTLPNAKELVDHVLRQWLSSKSLVKKQST